MHIELPMKALIILFFSLIHLEACHSPSRIREKENTSSDPVNAESQPNKPQEVPVNWPWRGVSVESKKTTAADMAYLKSVHVNFVRIFIKGDKRSKRELMTPTEGFYRELTWADSILDAAAKEGITCMIAFNNLILDPQSEVNDKRPAFWNNTATLDSVYRMVDIIARRYAHRGNELTAYEVIGEPALNDNGDVRTPDKITSFYSTVLTTIRKYDQKRFFLLTPGPWGKPANYKGFNGYPIQDSKLIYGAHMYMPDEFTHQGVKQRPRGFEYPGTVKLTYWDKELLRKQMKDLKEFENKTGALILVGEFQSVRWARGANTWVKDVLDLLEENKWSWAMYGYQCDTEFWDPYFDVANRNEDPDNWKLEYKGKNTEEWKILTDYFRKNAEK